jgi:sec-independent protein translocase protein TatA
MNLPLANLFGVENWMLIAFVALLIFGRRLPEVGRSMGKGIIEFKKGLQGIEDDIETATTAKPPQQQLPGVQTQTPAQLPTDYKFDPYTGQPVAPPPVQRQTMKFDPYTGKPLDTGTGATPGTV